jgi:hypothetical protein
VQSTFEPDKSPMSYSIELELQQFLKAIVLKDGAKATL